MNLHASLLPKYRGAAPITWAVAEGETESGVSLMQMDEGMDTGPVFSQHRVPIGPDMTAGELSVALAACAARVVREDLARAVFGELHAEPQDESRATHARLLDKSDGKIDFSKTAKHVHDHVRGMTPWPGAFTDLGGKLFKVLETRRLDGAADGPPGTVLVASKGHVEIACGSGRVALLRGQLEGKKPLAASELVSGRALTEGARFGAGTG